MASAAPPPMANPPLPPLSGDAIALIVLNTVFFLIPTLAVFGRLWSRRLNRQPLGSDDYFIIPALVVWWAQVGFNYWAFTNGAIGYNVKDVGLVPVTVILEHLTISQFTYAVCFFFIRLSICLLILRIFARPWLRICIYVAIAVNACWAIFVIVSQAAICRPFAFNWDITIPGGTCNNTIKLNIYVANAVWTIIYDLCVLLIPQPIIWRLHMALSTRAMLSGIFFLAFFDIIVSIIRIVFIVKVDFANVTGSVFLPYLWTLLELSIALTVACLPMLQRPLQRMFPWLHMRLTSRGGSSDKTPQGVPAKQSELDTPNSRRKKYYPELYTEIDEEDSVGMDKPVELVPPGVGQGKHEAEASVFAPSDRQGLGDGSIRMQRDVTVEYDHH